MKKRLNIKGNLVLAIGLLILFFMVDAGQSPAQKMEDLSWDLMSADGRDKVDLLNELADCCTTSHPEKSQRFSKQAITLSEQIHYKKGQVNGLMNLCWCYIGKGKFEEAMKFAQTSLKISQRLRYQGGIENAEKAIGLVYWNRKDYKNAQKYLAKNLKALKWKDSWRR